MSSERFHPNMAATYEPNIIRDKYERLADAEQLSAIRDDLMAVSIALAPLDVPARTKADLQAAINRCTLNVLGKIGRPYVSY